MKKSTRIEMLTLLLEIIERENNNSRGICYHIGLMILHGYSEVKIDTFLSWFLSQKPHQYHHSKFFKHETFTNGMWWWTRYNDEAFKQRKKFIKHLIEYQSK
jgi:hypothetical protein